jgi:glutamine synthetase
MTNAKFNILKTIKDNEIKFLDFRFTDLEGRWHHVTKSAEDFDENEIINFDGSSIKGWRSIENSDMLLKPDFESFFVDPFSVQNTAVIFCDVHDPLTGKPYTNDPRSIAKLAEKHFLDTKMGDAVYFGPEPEFFIFDDVRFKTSPSESFFKVTTSEASEQSEMQIEGGNLGHRTGKKGGYMPVSPVDHLFDIRSEMVTVMREIGVNANLHHHEVAAGQCELGFKFDLLTKTADNTQKYKYVVQNVAASFGKSATFMAKPVFGDNGSGMHVHQSIWKENKNLFAGKEYAGLSETALFYIGGIIKHAEAIAAFSNSTTNSYKRLVRGYEAPTMLAYSASNRSAAIRIPYSEGDKAKRIEARFPDPSSNPYLLFAALLMAGIDGIKNKIHPDLPREENLYKVNDISVKKMPSSLEISLKALEKNHEFLLQGGVFTKEMIHSYIEVKMKDVEEMNKLPHPYEFKMYY